MANMIARLGVLLGLDTAEFNKGLADSGNRLERFTSTAKTTALAVGAAFSAMTLKATMYADEVADIAAANDVAIDTVVKLQNALVGAGGQAENASKMFASFTNYVDKAAEGSFEAQKNFAKIGISLTDLANLSTQDLFLKTIQGISGIEDSLTRSAKGFEMLGKASKGVDLVGLADQIQKGADVTDRQANAIKLLADFWGKFEMAGRSATLNFINIIEPGLRKVNEQLEIMARLAQQGNIIGGFFDILSKQFKDARAQATLEEIERLNAKIADPNVGEFWKSGYRQELAAAKKLLIELQGESAKAFQADVRRIDNAMGAGGERASVTGGPRRAVKEGVNPEDEKRKREEEKEQKRLSDMYARAHRARLEEQADIDASVLAYGRLITSVDEYQNSQRKQIELDEVLADLESRRHRMADFEYQYQREFINLTAQRTEAIERLKEMDLMPSDREERIKRQNELYQRQVDLIVKIRDTERAKTIGTVGQGFMAEMREFFRTMPTDMETGAAMFGSMMMNMNRALDNFVRTGKLNFKDFARSVIQDLIAIQLKAQAMKFFANLFGFNTPTTAGTTVPVVDAIPRANGGPVMGSQAYLVGERGPELFVPRMSGTIIPNKSMGMIGNTTQVTNNYINAIDVKSFEERILGSSNAVWAANLYAQKRLPLGAGRM